MNEELRTGCPACSGTGQVTFIRSGAWLNKHCPGKNGPTDVDSSPLTHELDNYFKKRKARVEYKNPGEPIGKGQEYHFIAELESVASDWWALFVLIIDDGQGFEDQTVRYKWRDSRTTPTWGDAEYHEKQLGELGKLIADWLWQ